RVRPRPDRPAAEDNGSGPEEAEALRTDPIATESSEAPPREQFSEDGYTAFDEEINSRYEEIKRGSTHISELQGMTMPQLLKVAKDEGLTDYTGLKKQDLIFRILKERVKQNGPISADGTQHAS